MNLSKLALITVMSIIPFTSNAHTNNLSIQGDHGKLSAVMQTPDGLNKYPLVILCHGFTSSKEVDIFTNLADKLEKNGIASIRFDFNGHGQSEGKFEDMTVINEIEDTKKVYNYVKDLHEVTKIALAGHSQGGVVSSMVAGELGADKIKSLVLMAPAAVLRDDAIRGQIFDIRYDSVNPPKNVDLHDKDHEGYKIGYNYIKTAQTLPIYETAKNYAGPACLIHGTHDIVVPYTYSLHYKEIFKNGELHLIEGDDHGFTHSREKAVNTAKDYLVKTLQNN